jgi:hypothetical protein
MSAALMHTVRSGLAAQLNPLHVDELLASYVEAKENFYAGGLRLSAVEGGRFCEAAFRLLQEAAKLSVTKLGTSIKSEVVIKALESLPKGQQPDSIRLHIPRALRVIYDIRNNRDAAHLGDGIDPNLQDATLVATVLDWVLAEFVRLYHNISADAAQKIVESLVTRRAPAVETFGVPEGAESRTRCERYGDSAAVPLWEGGRHLRGAGKLGPPRHARQPSSDA